MAIQMCVHSLINVFTAIPEYIPSCIALQFARILENNKKQKNKQNIRRTAISMRVWRMLFDVDYFSIGQNV